MHRSPFISVIRFLLAPFALIYGVVVWLRNRLYDSGFSSSVEFSLPVICVGNLSVGGTGKTPHVEYLLRLLQYRYRVATMSRGYKRATQGFQLADRQSNALRIGDEPMQYHLRFPEVAVSVAEERMTGIPLLLQRRPDIEVVILDDAYQHRSVKAGHNILITDFNRPFYKDFILPYGQLREGRGAYKRAHAIIVSKCPPELTQVQAGEIEAQIKPLAHQKLYFTTIHYGQAYALLTHEPVNIRAKNILLVCCIAKPAPLVAHLEAQAAEVHVLSYRDHHYFVSSDLEEIRQTFEAWEVPDKVIVTTEKDATRLLLHHERLREAAWPIAVLPIEVRFLFGAGDRFNAQVHRYIDSLKENDESDVVYSTMED